MPIKSTADSTPEDRDFATWLRQTIRKLKDGDAKQNDLPPESWERHYSPFEESAAQRRIAALIAEIAERPRDKKRPR